jgi:hypothetical protein
MSPSVPAPRRRRLLLLVVSLGLAAACTANDHEATPTSPPAVTESGTTQLAVTPAATTKQPTTTEPATTERASTESSTAPRPSSVELAGPPDQDRSEPHIAVDPEDSDRMFVVAQGSLPTVSLEPQLFWHTEDGGRTWSEPLRMGFIDNSARGAAGDPVVATGRDGLVLFGTLAVMIEGDPETVGEASGSITAHIGTRISTNSGHSFSSFGTADRIVITGPTPENIDKEWLAIDVGAGPFAGSAYLAWVHFNADGSEDVLFAASRDSGRTYAAPLVLEHLRGGQLRGEIEEYVQVAVRPDGTVDAVWNSTRAGEPVVVHAHSTNGGTSFSSPRPIVHHDPGASGIGMVLSLAVSARGRLGLCWPQARPGRIYLPQIRCQQTDDSGHWARPELVLPGVAARQYLPAAVYHGETLWVTSYVSDEDTTRVLAVPHGRHGFDPAITLTDWPVPSRQICAPHPPDCTDGQTFIGDYIGAVATPDQLVVSAIEPAARRGHNKLVILRLPFSD